MSKALDYLLTVRKEAVGAYFKFLKQGGEHLDPKTRTLLSVITKVDAQTETGLKQYLPRALAAGNSADEILDALLVCLPSLGMSKIIWAVDIILALELPEFASDLIGQQKQWHRLAPVNELPEGASRLDYGNGRACFVYKVNDNYQVFDSHCPHQVTNIPQLAICGTTVTCPKHGWKFDLTDGRCIEKGNRPLNVIQSKVEAEVLYVYS